MTRREVYLVAGGVCVGAMLVTAWATIGADAFMMAVVCVMLGSVLGHAWRSR